MNGFMKYSREPIVGSPEVGVLIFGLFYLMYRGLWLHVFVFALLFFPTFGIVWVWYIFKTRQYLTRKLYIEGYFKD